MFAHQYNLLCSALNGKYKVCYLFRVLIENMVYDGDDDELSGFLVGLATSSVTPGGS